MKSGRIRDTAPPDDLIKDSDRDPRKRALVSDAVPAAAE
jgi:hypothetical protein